MSWIEEHDFAQSEGRVTDTAGRERSSYPGRRNVRVPMQQRVRIRIDDCGSRKYPDVDEKGSRGSSSERQSVCRSRQSELTLRSPELLYLRSVNPFRPRHSSPVDPLR